MENNELIMIALDELIKSMNKIGTTLYDYSYLRIKELNDTLKIFNKYYDWGALW